MVKRIIGIDFGTTNSSVAVFEGDEAVVVQNNDGLPVTATVFSKSVGKDMLVGNVAKQQAMIYPEDTVDLVKQTLGEGNAFNLGGEDFLPHELAARMFVKLKQDAEAYLGAPIEKAVVTVPAHFNDGQRNAIKASGQIAGLEVVRMINEPTSAALAKKLDHIEAENVLVYDLGGGTFDVSVLELENGVYEVISSSGHPKLGGKYFEEGLQSFIIDRFQKTEGGDLYNDLLALQKIKDVSEKAKIALSEKEEVRIQLPFITADDQGPKNLDMVIKRKDFETIIEKEIDQTIGLMEDALSQSKIDKKDIHHILLIGGSSKIPLVKKKMEAFFFRELSISDDCELAVVKGAAMQAGILEGLVKGHVLVDVTPLSLGIEIEGGLFIPLVSRNTTIPAKEKRMFTTIADNQSTVEIKVFQGEYSEAVENFHLGTFTLEKINPEKRGVPRIEVIFEINVDGILTVQATNLDTQEKQKIRITDSFKLSDVEIKRMIKRAKKEKTPLKIEEWVKWKTKFDHRVEQMKGLALTDESKNKLETYQSEFQESQKSKDTDNMKRIVQDLGDFKNGL